MEGCIFCKIIKGEIPATKIYEDDSVFAFLDIQPLTKGHALVIPKQHAENVFDIDNTVLQNIIVAGKKIASDMQKDLGAVGINFLQSNGKKAGQVVFHYHMHIIPRYENDNLKMNAFSN